MSKSKIILAFLGGAAVGAAVGIFFASDKGSEMRKKVTDKAKDLADSILSKAEEIVNEAEANAKKARSEKT